MRRVDLAIRLAADLRNLIGAKVAAASEYITVPEVTLPSGIVVPSFRVAKYAMSRGIGGIAVSVADQKPWVNITYHEARQACADSGFALITESQELAIRHNVAQQNCNWTKGKVGEGKLFRGIRKSNVSSAQPGTFESSDVKERRWMTLSNGERICDINGNVYSWIFDDVQGDENGLTGKIAADSISLTTAPFPSQQKGMGRRPDGGANWSGLALVRGGYWSSESYAGVFYLSYGYPDLSDDDIGFRCTLGL